MVVDSVQRGVATLGIPLSKVTVGMAGRSGPAYEGDRSRYVCRVDTLGRVRSLKVPEDHDSPQFTSLMSTGESGFLGPVLPDRPVAPGDTWTARQRPQLHTNRREFVVTYTFEGWVEQEGMRLVRITSRSSPPTIQLPNTKVRATLRETYLFDPKAGRLVSGKVVWTKLTDFPATATKPAGQQKSEDIILITVTEKR